MVRREGQKRTVRIGQRRIGKTLDTAETADETALPCCFNRVSAPSTASVEMMSAVLAPLKASVSPSGSSKSAVRTSMPADGACKPLPMHGVPSDLNLRFCGAEAGVVLRGRVLVERRRIVGAKTGRLVDNQHIRSTAADQRADGNTAGVAALGRRGNVHRIDIGERACSAVVEINRAEGGVRRRRRRICRGCNAGKDEIRPSISVHVRDRGSEASSAQIVISVSGAPFVRYSLLGT